MLLECFERERYAVIGRPAEGTTAGTALGAVKAFSVVYLKCEPSKGLGSHAHASAEVIIVIPAARKIDS